MELGGEGSRSREEESDPVRGADGEDGSGADEGDGWVGVIENCGMGGAEHKTSRVIEIGLLLSWSMVVMIQQILLSQLDAMRCTIPVQCSDCAFFTAASLARVTWSFAWIGWMVST